MKELRSFQGKESHRPGEERYEGSEALEVGFGAATEREPRTPHHPPLCTTWPWTCRTCVCGPVPGPRLEVLGLTVGGCALALDIRVGLALEAGGN